jgi:hypothetical protein
MKKILIALFVLAVFVAGCTQQPIGGQRDEHGCLIAAGYSWCEVKQKCLRTWEEECRMDSFEDCVSAGYPVLESFPQQCVTSGGQTFVFENAALCTVENAAVYTCGRYLKIVSETAGAGASYITDESSFSCPVVAPDLMSDECRDVQFINCTQIC